MQGPIRSTQRRILIPVRLLTNCSESPLGRSEAGLLWGWFRASFPSFEVFRWLLQFLRQSRTDGATQNNSIKVGGGFDPALTCNYFLSLLLHVCLSVPATMLRGCEGETSRYMEAEGSRESLQLTSLHRRGLNMHQLLSHAKMFLLTKAENSLNLFRAKILKLSYNCPSINAVSHDDTPLGDLTIHLLHNKIWIVKFLNCIQTLIACGCSLIPPDGDEQPPSNCVCVCVLCI